MRQVQPRHNGWTAVTTDSNAAGSEPTPPDRKQAAAASSNKSHESEEIGEPADTSDARDADERDTLKSEADDTANAVKRDPPACAIRVLGQCLVAKEKEEAAPNPKPAGGTAKVRGQQTASPNARGSHRCCASDSIVDVEGKGRHVNFSRSTEMALNVLGYNLTRVLNIIGVKPLLAAKRA